MEIGKIVAQAVFEPVDTENAPVQEPEIELEENQQEELVDVK